MAKNTNIDLRNKSIYQVFTRQFSKTHDFKGIIKDLDRIKQMGFDIIYLLPFHPIGLKDRKGSVGSPYSIIDYYEIDELNGTLDDFMLLKAEISKRNMKLMIDIVFNHTSRDSVLVNKHFDWFYKNENGLLANRVGDWSDIADLDFNKKDVWIYLADVLKYWAKYVDGFRCDVAPLLPIEFWQYAKKEVAKVNEDMIWLTESVEPGFIKYIRDMGFDAMSDSQMYDVFDICYDYDIFKHMDDFLSGKDTLKRWLEAIMMQETMYPKNYVKLRSFENHDQERIAKKAKNEYQLINLMAMQFFIKGMPMVYAGGEHQIKHRPDLFEIDLIQWDKTKSIETLITKLNQLKKDAIMSSGVFNLVNSEHAIFSYQYENVKRIGIFDLEDRYTFNLDIADGKYVNLINDETIEVSNKEIKSSSYPIIFEIKE